MFKRFKLWRSQTWNRGHQVGYDLAQEHFPRDKYWTKRLEEYYYAHINDCLKKKCERCKCLDKKS